MQSEIYDACHLCDRMDKFFDRMVEDLETYAAHAKRKTIEVEDVKLLLRRFVYVSVFVVVVGYDSHQSFDYHMCITNIQKAHSQTCIKSLEPLRRHTDVLFPAVGSCSWVLMKAGTNKRGNKLLTVTLVSPPLLK